jgi:hypothetical protein
MTLQLPTLLALLGAALMAVAIFVPQKPVTKIAARPPAVVVHNAISTWMEPPLSPPAGLLATVKPISWPTLLDSRATDCDIDARREIAQALGALGEHWCAGIIARALDEETDADVRLALSQAAAAG